MAGRERRQSRAEWQIGRDLADVGSELRRARLRNGLTLGSVATGIGLSPSTVLRHERASASAAPVALARHAAAVGLRLRLSLYPGSDAIHDAGQVALIRRFPERIGNPGRWDAEVPIPADRDQRAFDAVLTLPSGRVGIEFFVRLADAQAQWRNANLKKRDAGLDRLLVVLGDTPSNRKALRQVGSALGDVSVGHSRTLLALLAAGIVPASDGIILI